MVCVCVCLCASITACIFAFLFSRAYIILQALWSVIINGDDIGSLNINNRIDSHTFLQYIQLN